MKWAVNMIVAIGKYLCIINSKNNRFFLNDCGPTVIDLAFSVWIFVLDFMLWYYVIQGLMEL